MIRKFCDANVINLLMRNCELNFTRPHPDAAGVFSWFHFR